MNLSYSPRNGHTDLVLKKSYCENDSIINENKAAVLMGDYYVNILNNKALSCLQSVINPYGLKISNKRIRTRIGAIHIPETIIDDK